MTQNQLDTPSFQRNARIVGLLVLPLVLLGPFSLVYVPSLVTDGGNVGASASLLVEHAQIFRLGLLAELGIAFAEIGMIVALYRLFERGGRDLAMAAALARAMMVALMGVSMVAGLAALELATLGLTAPVGGLMALRDAVQPIWGSIFAFHLLLMAPVVVRSGLVPKVFGWGLLLGGLGYALDSVGVMLWPGLAPTTEVIVAVGAMVGELPLFIWLLIKGVAPAAPLGRSTDPRLAL